MFGSRLKTWMENYIGRPRKKEVQKEKSKGAAIILESSESLACSDTGISFSSQQVLSSTTDNKEGYSTTTMESERSGITHCHTAVSLPSPESAYSTGYSTDGASPGEPGPPEYYINIRTGKHYFPSPVPTPTSPQPHATILQHHPANHRPSTSFLPKNSSPPSNAARLSRKEVESSLSEAFRAKSRVRTLTRFSNGLSPHLDSFAAELRSDSRGRNALSASVPSYFEILNFSKSPCKRSSPKSQLTPIKLFLKSPRHEKGTLKENLDSANKKKASSAGKPKKWYKHPFQKFGNRRTDPCDETAAKNQVKREEVHLEKNFRYSLGQENSASPRQRNRIKTNPWLPTEPMSLQNFHNLRVDFSPSLTRNRSCSNTPLQNRKTNDLDSLQIRSNHSNENRMEETKGQPNKFEKVVNRMKLAMEPSDHSEEDLTLNEVMGTYNESYVYEKETDILSDSDPTDCEDYGTDSEADNGGDERDSHDDELDFIDNGSVYESDDNLPQNTGKCSYHDVRVKKNSFLHKSERRKFRKESECRKNSRKEQDSKIRREKRRQTRKFSKPEDEERRKVFEEKVKPKVEIDENVGGLNLGRVLLQRMMTAKNVSRSAEGTPVRGRRRKELGETENEKPNAVGKKPGIAADAILIDFEADNRYNELIREAENMFESLRNAPPMVKEKENVGPTREEETAKRNPAPLDFPRDATADRASRCQPKESPARKSPKELALKLSTETPRKLKRLDFGSSEKSNFKTRSSAHSPLDPLGPTLRNFAVFDPGASGDGKISTSSSEDSGPDKPSARKECKGRRSVLPGSPVVPIAFQSVDLGKVFASYCPQSEPVKRKIYSCSKTYDKLAKRFENKPTIFEETKSGKLGSASPETKDVRPDGRAERTLPGRGPRQPPFAAVRRSAPEKPRRRSPHSDVPR